MRWFQMLLLLFSCPVMSNSLWPHGLQHTRPPCPSPSPRVCPSSCSLHRWYPIHLIFWHPLLLPSIFPSIRVFSNESAVCTSYKMATASLSCSKSGKRTNLIRSRLEIERWGLQLSLVKETTRSHLREFKQLHYKKNPFFAGLSKKRCITR